ncbi:MAG: hypothetical protein PWQ16_1315 [bacterium]|nr:MAG: Diguanylate cyclase [bacterium 42_11]MDK2871963.1 hypothetical protein [bacterium]
MLAKQVNSFKEKIYIFLTLLFVGFAIMQTWLFINNAFTLEQFIMSTLSVFILFVGLTLGLNMALIIALISIFLYGSAIMYIYFRAGGEIEIGTTQFFWLIAIPCFAYLGGLLHREYMRIYKSYANIVTNIDELVALDEVVGLENSKRFAFRVTEEISRAKRYGGKFSVLLLKIAYLQELADVHGETVKNLVLKKVAEVLKDNKRYEDFLAYLSEGEYGFLLPNTPKEGAENMRNRIKQKLLYVDVVPKEGDFRRIKLTVKTGIATYPDDGEDYTALLWVARRGFEYDLK